VGGGRVRILGTISFVVPVLNEEACLGELYRRLAALGDLPAREMIFVDDGSRDGSFALIERLATADQRVRGIRLRENVGSQRALLCGMRAARGDVIVTLDADLQHPPELTAGLVDEWRRGTDVVEMLRRHAPGDGWLRDLVTPLFYRAFNLVSSVPLDPRSTDFRLLDRRIVAALTPQSGELVRTAVARVAGQRARLEFDVPRRFAGRSRYRAIDLALLGAAAIGSALHSRQPAPPLEVALTVGVGL
jgi:dolichol-phosphate mannosyltransferase